MFVYYRSNFHVPVYSIFFHIPFDQVLCDTYKLVFLYNGDIMGKFKELITDKQFLTWAIGLLLNNYSKMNMQAKKYLFPYRFWDNKI